MKKSNIYYSTIFWTSALTALVGCSYYRGNNMVEGTSQLFELRGQTTQSHQLSNLKNYMNTNTSIDVIIIQYGKHIKKCLQIIEDSSSIFREKDFNHFIKEFKTFLNTNQEKLKNGALLNLPIIDYSSTSTNFKEASIKNDQELISQSDDLEFKDPNHTYLLYLINIKESLSIKINEIEQNLPIKCPYTTQLSEEEKWNMTQQEDKAKKRKNTLQQIIPFICCNKETTNKVYTKDKNTTFSGFNDGTPANKVDYFILDSFLDYHYKLFNVLTIHALNESIHKKKAKIKQAKKQYEEVCSLITNIYTTSINSYRLQLTNLLKTASNNKPKKDLKDNDNDINHINKLSNDYLKSIDDKMNKLNKLISSMLYDSDSILKDGISKILKVFYNIISIYIAIEILLDFSTIAALNRIDLTAWKVTFDQIPAYSTPLPAYTTSTLQRYIIQVIKFTLYGDNQYKKDLNESTDKFIRLIRYIVSQPPTRRVSY